MVELITATAEFAKDPHLRPEDIAQLRDWLKKQPHLPQSITDELLIAILHSSDYSIEQAKQLLETNITCRTNCTEIFSNRDPLAKRNQAVWNCVDFWVSPHVTEEKYRICFGGLNNYAPELFDFAAILNVFATLLDTSVGVFGICPGYVVILNCQGVTLSHLARANVTLIRDILHYVQEAVTLKIKAIHVINVSPVIDKIMFVVKPFLKKALLDMLYFHSGEMEDFYKSVPKNILPHEIGGTNGHTQEFVEMTKKRMEELREWLLEWDKLILDETKRTNKDDNYSVAGSFRKLGLD